jgi:SET domain-containing protein
MGSDTAMKDSFPQIPLDPRQYSRTDEYSFVLKPAGTKGIGVFATHGIAKGTKLDLFPNGQTREFSRAQLDADPRLDKFCQFYGVDTEDGSSCAPHFGCMSVGWYLNHADEPCAARDEQWDYFAGRDIAAGEEITIDYRAL